MKYITAVLGTVAFYASEVADFPAAAIQYAANVERGDLAASNINGAIAKHRAAILEEIPGFNATAQYASTSGQYAFIAPNLFTDQRGPCPGLNAMANHGYISHNGVATIRQFIDGTYQAFGMGKDLDGFLARYGALIDANLESWSIGGPTPAVTQTLGLLGEPQGISGSHNGNDYKVIVLQFQQLFDMQPDAATANYDLTVLTDFRAVCSNNPSTPAAYTVIYCFMANKSAEYPEGILNQDVLKSFYSITGESGSFVWTEGYGKFPEKWYKRGIGDEYTVPFFFSDLLAAAEKYPQFLDIGGNAGKTNTFTGVDIQDLTGGVFNAVTLLQGDNAICFAFQELQQAAPDLLKGLVTNVKGTMNQLDGAITNLLSGLNCPKLNIYDVSQFNKYPGADNCARC